MTQDICILDTETLGIDPDAPIWDFAAVRRYTDGAEDRTEFRIQHDPGHYLDELPERFRADYDARYIPRDAMPEFEAAIMINIVTRDSIVIGCNPGFDIERLDKLVRRHGMTPSWHYHPLDIASMAIGFLAGRGFPPPQPWKSDRLADAIGVTSATFERHTAMGDVKWAAAQWDQIMGGRRVDAAVTHVIDSAGGR